MSLHQIESLQGIAKSLTDMRTDFAALKGEVQELQKNTRPGGYRFWLPTVLAGVAAVASILSLLQ